MIENFGTAQFSTNLAQAALKRGDLAEAATLFIEALKSDPRNADAYYHLARIYSLAGQDAAATQVFRLAIEVLPQEFLSARTFVRYQGQSFDARTTQNFFAALAETTPVLQDYLAPSVWLGTHGAEQTLQQDAAIAERLDLHWSSWEDGRTDLPPQASAFHGFSPVGTPPPRTLVFMPQHVLSNPEFVASTYAAHPCASLAEIGIPSEFHPADHLCFNVDNPDSLWIGRKPKAAALADFEIHLARFRPDIVLIDGMFTESDATIGVADLRQLKARYGFKLINLVADAYPPLPNYAAHWAYVSDLTVALTGDAYLAEIDHGATFSAPCQALAQSLIRETANSRKTVDLLYAGARTRNRDFWAAHAVMAGLDATVMMSDRRADLAQTEADFYETLGCAKLALSNGYVAPDLDIVVFRPFEAAASGAVILHNGHALEGCFIPYVHYLPFDNVHEMVCLARFLLSHETYRYRIQDAARTFWHGHYRGELFWRAIFGRLAI